MSLKGRCYLFLEQPPPLKCDVLKDYASQILEMKQYLDQSLLQETLMEDGCAGRTNI